MKKALTKDTYREIKKSFGRFISIFGIVLVGVAFFTGVKASAPYMKKSADAFFDRTNFFDFKIYSTIGFNDEDIEAVRNTDGIESAEGAFVMEAVTRIEGNEKTFQIMSYDFDMEDDETLMNRLTLVDGRMPENPKECVIRSYEMQQYNIGIGDQITFESGSDSDISESISNDTYTIVGTVNTPYYLSYQYDSTSVGNGKIEGVVFIPEKDFVMEQYTVVYATVTGAKELHTYKDEYFLTTDPVKDKVEEVAKEREEIRYNELGDIMETYTGSRDGVPTVKWYVLDRNSHFSYVDYGNCGDRMDAIAKVFPVFFYLVAALVCLTTMTRMIDEQRGNIGTFKALGYGKLRIAMKYVTYALIASLSGGIAGCILGLISLPKIIFSAWGIVYTVDGMVADPEPLMCILSILIAVLVTVVSTVIACVGELTETPALLLRPKSPKNGKKILLEHIHFLWKRFSFTWKVTARNIFRYKKRFFMTVVGIAGCTALILAGFGINNSVSGMVTRQFGQIFDYDIAGTLSDGCDKEAFYTEYSNHEGINNIYILTQLSGTANNSDTKGDSSEKSVTIVSVSDADRYSEFTDITDNKSGKELTIPDDGVYLTYKMAKDLKLESGDDVYLKTDEDEYVKAEIKGIVTMYAGQYAFMSDDYYREIFGKEPENNYFIAGMNYSDTHKQQELGAEIMDKYDVENISYYDAVKDNFDQMISSLSIITVVLIISAALLAFVVLYNLITVNVSERIREIATIKVLGFYDNEVASYVYRENIVLSIIGAAAGLFLGVCLHSYIMDVIEMDDVIFPKIINWYSYLLAFVITVIFGLIVNLAMYKKLKKIPMVESLKSVE